MQNGTTLEDRGSDRRRPDWQENDRRQTWPWVKDSNDRRTGEDRRLDQRRVRQAMNGRLIELSRRNLRQFL